MTENSSATRFYLTMTSTLHQVIDRQRQEIERAGSIIADAVLAGGLIHAFGSGHSEAMAMEVAARAGGLIPTNRISFRDLVVFGAPIPRCSWTTRSNVNRERLLPCSTWRMPGRAMPSSWVRVLASTGWSSNWPR